MAERKRYRLWTTRELVPAIVEIIDNDPIEPDQIREIVDQLRVVTADSKTLILGPAWEVRVPARPDAGKPDGWASFQERPWWASWVLVLIVLTTILYTAGLAFLVVWFR